MQEKILCQGRNFNHYFRVVSKIKFLEARPEWHTDPLCVTLFSQEHPDFLVRKPFGVLLQTLFWTLRHAVVFLFCSQKEKGYLSSCKLVCFCWKTSGGFIYEMWMHNKKYSLSYCSSLSRCKIVSHSMKYLKKKKKVFNSNAKTPAMPLTAFRGGSGGGKLAIQYYIIFRWFCI